LADNGQDALDFFDPDAPEPPFAIVLMDLQMPVLDGYEAARRLRSLNDTWAPDLPVIAMTAHNREAEADACRKAGLDDHIGKPIDVDALFSVLQGWRPVVPVTDGTVAEIVMELYEKLKNKEGDADDCFRKIQPVLINFIHEGRVRRIAEMIQAGCKEDAAAYLARLNSVLHFMPCDAAEAVRSTEG
jgi:CheY-like chemotaxis protein